MGEHVGGAHTFQHIVVDVAYDMAGTNWKLSVSDDGIGKPDGVFAQGKSGLGTFIRGRYPFTAPVVRPAT